MRRQNSAPFARLGIPVNLKKLELEGKPATLVKFLGILIDTARMECRLDPDRLAAIKASLDQWADRSHCTRGELQCLIGTLSFASKVVKPCRVFLRRLLETLRRCQGRSGRIHLRGAFRKDLQWWRRFIAGWNGTGIILPTWESACAADSDRRIGAWDRSSLCCAALVGHTTRAT